MGLFPEPVEPLSDGVVTLRRWRDVDADDLVPIARDPQVVRWTTVPSPYGIEDAENFLALMGDMWRDDARASFAIVEPPDGELLGAIDLRNTAPGTGVAEIGYMISPHARGRGVAPRALDLITRWGFDECGFARIEVHVPPGNDSSLAVPPKAGYEREGLLRSYRPGRDGTRQDLVMFSRLRD